MYPFSPKIVSIEDRGNGCFLENEYLFIKCNGKNETNYTEKTKDLVEM